ncbi:MAG: DUF502 domain-containing protein [bacterium]|nr:DUF502 domain-containing protein [bacterium]
MKIIEHIEPKSRWKQIRKNFITGLITLLPLSVTMLFFLWIMEFIHDKLNFIPQQLFPENHILITLFEVIFFILILFAICLVGIMTNHYIGKKLIQTGDNFLNKIPLLRTIYSGSKQILETFTTSNKKSFKQVVLVEFPRKGIWCFGFITGELDYFQLKKKKTRLTTVFVPTTPNPTTGYLFLMTLKDIHPIAMSIETAFKMIISGGILSHTMNLRETKA